MTSRDGCGSVLTPGTTRDIVTRLPDVAVTVYCITSAVLHKHCVFLSFNKNNLIIPMTSLLYALLISLRENLFEQGVFMDGSLDEH